jgi:anti-anti-sigma regulatory factor
MAKNAGAEFILFDINQAILNIFRLAYLDKFFTILTRKDLVERYPQFK